MTGGELDSVREERLLGGDETALAELFAQHEPRLKRMVKLRLNRRLLGRVDPSDVLQESFIDLQQRLEQYIKAPNIPVFLWMRLVTAQRLAQVHRMHLQTAMRNAAQEVTLYHKAFPQASTEFLASQLMGHFTSVSEKVMRAEVQLKLQESLNAMDPTDREVLALRHFEELSNVETAGVLGITTAAASKRYIRALRRLRRTLSSVPGLIDN